MPELPEVEVVRQGLEQWAVDRTVTDVEVLDARSLRRHAPGRWHFAERIIGAKILGAKRRGKYLWIPVEVRDGDSEALVVHLGMSGQMLVSEAWIPDHRHLRIRVRLDNGPDELRFVDQRIFGGLYLDHLVVVADAESQVIPTSITHIGRDPLDPLFDLDAVTVKIRRRKTGLKRALLDQTIASGIGNIYADEALWLAGMHYARPTDTMTRPEVRKIYAATQRVMAAALDEGGTSFDALYVNVNGESGYFARSLNVYGRADEYCRRCLDAGRETFIVREKFMNRSATRCPACQPVPHRPRW